MAPPPSRQQASIVLGYDRPDYTTSSKITQQFDTIRKDINLRSSIDANKNKECHVVFGDQSKKREFTLANTQPDPTGQIHQYTAKLNGETKMMLLKTSTSFGSDVADYRTSTQIATQYDSTAANDTIRLRNEIRKRTGPRPTRGMSYDDEIHYISESKSQFDNKFNSYKPSLMEDSVKKDLRATHFTLGNERAEYTTSSHIERLCPSDFAIYSTPATLPHDLRMSTVDMS